MKRYFLLFGSLVLLFFRGTAFAQEEEEPIKTAGWSVMVFTSGAYSVSSSMHGSISDYENALASGATPSRYPFDSYRAYAASFGIGFDYRFLKSSFGLYFGGYGLGFQGGQGFRSSPEGRFNMTIVSAPFGIEYTTGQLYQSWNFYGKIGLVPSVVAVTNRNGNPTGARFFNDSLGYNAAEGRLGFELEAGERYHFPRWPIGIEASINYTNINFFGKTYSTPTFGSLFNGSTSINDGKNPNDPNDSPRIIDFLSLKIGARYYF